MNPTHERRTNLDTKRTAITLGALILLAGGCSSDPPAQSPTAQSLAAPIQTPCTQLRGDIATILKRSTLRGKVLDRVDGYCQQVDGPPIIPTTVPATVVPPTTTTTNPATIPLTEAAIRDAVAKGGTVQLGPGTVNITHPLRIGKSGTKLIGAGVDKTILRMAFGPTAYGPLIALPAEWSLDFNGNPPPASMRVSDVEIANLSIDGAREGNPNTYGGAQANTIRFGIQSTISTNTSLHDLHIYDIAGDAIAFGNGTGVNVNPTVSNVVIERAGRNGIHLGHTDHAVIKQSKILDTPGVYWEKAGAGNGIDIEVEGQDPSVRHTLIEDNEISRPNNGGYAGFGIQITRAFGDVDDVLVQRNTFRNHQQGVLVSSSTNVRILDNRFETSPAGVNNVTGGGVGLIAYPGYPASVLVSHNTFNLEPWLFFCDNVVSVNGAGDWQVRDNEMYGCDRVFRAYGEPSHLIASGNKYRLRVNAVVFDNSMQGMSTYEDNGSEVL